MSNIEKISDEMARIALTHFPSLSGDASRMDLILRTSSERTMRSILNCMEALAAAKSSADLVDSAFWGVTNKEVARAYLLGFTISLAFLDSNADEADLALLNSLLPLFDQACLLSRALDKESEA